VEVLERAISAFGSVAEVPKALVQQRKASNAEVHRLVGASIETLTQRLDKLVGFFESELPDFVKAYRTARVIGPIQALEQRMLMAANTEQA
jgi:hypothetical protein